MLRPRKDPPEEIDNGSLAIFSPDCSAFWVSGGFADGNLKVVNAMTGKVTHTVSGTNPAWSRDSQNLFYFSGDNQIMVRDLPTSTSRLLLAVSDYVSCRAPGKGSVFNPVKAVSETELLWEYPISNQPLNGNRGTVAGKRVTYHAQTGEIIKSEEGGISCGQ